MADELTPEMVAELSKRIADAPALPWGPGDVYQSVCREYDEDALALCFAAVNALPALLAERAEMQERIAELLADKKAALWCLQHWRPRELTEAEKQKVAERDFPGLAEMLKDEGCE